MVYLSKIYTKTGDDGTTALGDGTRVPKNHPRIASYGTADELGAVLGVAATHADEATRGRIQRLQNDLFDLGADLCIPRKDDDEEDAKCLRIHESQVQRLEAEIDEINAHLGPLKSFVLSGGTPLAAHLHLARCVARRCEREVVALAESDSINRFAILYLNRLADLLFVMARAANSGDSEILWKPGGSEERA